MLVLPFIREAAKDVKVVPRRPPRVEPPVRIEPPPPSTTKAPSSTVIDSSDDDDSSEFSRHDDNESSSSQVSSSTESDESSEETTRAPTFVEQFEAWRARKREQRRHPTLVYFEKLVEREQIREDERVEEARLASLAHQEATAKRRAKVGRAIAFRDEVARRCARQRVDADARRRREAFAAEHRMRLAAQWDLQRAREQHVGVAEVRTEEEKSDAATPDEDEDDGVDTTQSVLRVMRSAGVVGGVNAPLAPALPEPRETNDALTLRLGEKKKRSVFAVEIRRFRNVERLAGENLGIVGARGLARELVGGACPMLAALDLGWNHIQLSGLAALAQAFRKKTPPKLRELDLRANHLPASAVDILVDALKEGGLHLTRLDLRTNQLGDPGAFRVASHVLAGDLPGLTRLVLQHNKIQTQDAIITDTYWGLPAFYLRNHLVGREKWDLRGVALHAFEKFATLPERRWDSPYLFFFKPTFCGWGYECPPLVENLVRNRTDIIWVGHDLTGMKLDVPGHALPGITIPGELASTIYHAWRYRGRRRYPHAHYLTFQGKCPSKLHAREWYMPYSLRGEMNRLFNVVDHQNYGNVPRPGRPGGINFTCIEKQRGRFSSDEIVQSYDALLDTVFALIPRGDERWSFRFLEAVGAGAIPVIVSDGLTLPFENVIDWEDIVVRIPEDLVVRMDTYADLLPLLPQNQSEIERRHRRLVRVNDGWLKDGDVIKDTFRLSIKTYLDTKQRLNFDQIDYDTYVPPVHAVPKSLVFTQPPHHAADGSKVQLKETAPPQLKIVVEPPPPESPWAWILEVETAIWHVVFATLGVLAVAVHLVRRRATMIEAVAVRTPAANLPPKSQKTFKKPTLENNQPTSEAL
ncbi:hypothetical protein CTAYLR_010799 [Chrysophaeum taylorii]|uniref:Exostosin GT47 domain-containing protein n=1 Tax=Chrysophaeum taylorii TaxID=2483200 RepID=A0AAD7UGZ8_9STRA|nr:hypothetical protein CTAYLR_010799 [Chrysophaeum taylorii]